MGKYRIVSDINSNFDSNDLVKKSFLRRNFLNAISELEKDNIESDRYSDEAKWINKALIYHILGEYDRAKELYEAYMDNAICSVNFMACCHRYFDYKKVEINLNKLLDKYKLPFENNYLNFLLATKGVEAITMSEISNSIFTEQILNDVFIKMGRSVLFEQNDILKLQYTQLIDVLEEKMIKNRRKKVGIFVTDIQRHKDAAIIFELVECLKQDFDIIIYFNNIFVNKLANIFKDICVVRHVINLYYEEVNNLIYEDNIDILIDLAGYGLRNNNIALAMMTNYIQIIDLLNDFPILLNTSMYFPEQQHNKLKECTCVIGDLRCVSDDELRLISTKIEGRLVFESHSLDEKVFKRNFKEKLIKNGFDMNRVDLLEGILPFSKYMEFLSSCKYLIISSGASYVELAEALKSGSNIIMMSSNTLISDTYNLYCNTYDDKLSRQELMDEKKQHLREFIMNQPSNILVKIKNRKSRIAYFENGKEICIGNTCYGDVVLLGE